MTDLLKHTRYFLPLLLGLTSCVQLPSTTQFNETLSYTEINGYKFHSAVFGDSAAPPVIVVHGGPGGDYAYLMSLKALAKNNRVIFYDQRGSGLSPRVDKKELTLETTLDDLHAIVQYYSPEGQVKLIGHSWGGMLVAGYLSAHPEKVSHAIMIEPGMLHAKAAAAFVEKMKETQSITDILALVGYITVYPFVSKEDGHEGFDYVMTKILNRNKPGAPYQCEGQTMPKNAFKRGGYEAFNNMLKPVIDDPSSFTYDLTSNTSKYKGELMLISSECSVFGYAFQEKHHISRLPSQTVHIKAEGMGHNMLTLNPDWSLGIVNAFFFDRK
ncbi:MAG: alpha/beta hydrolase [Ghiorsea sp.]|nr:alpha/beta hydrolase [Ghiorsea sp.]